MSARIPLMLCGGDECALQDLDEKFLYCTSCDMLFVRQSGALVWIYDAWSVDLALSLAAANFRAATASLNITDADVQTLLEAPV